MVSSRADGNGGPPRIAVWAGADGVQDGGSLTQRQATADLDRQPLPRAYLAVVDDVGLDDRTRVTGRTPGAGSTKP